MCHRSVGLIQNVVEAHGIATVSVTLKPEITLGVGVPRAAFLRFPMGHPTGRPGDARLQSAILLDLLGLAWRATRPNWVEELPYRWRGTRAGGSDDVSRKG